MRGGIVEEGMVDVKIKGENEGVMFGESKGRLGRNRKCVMGKVEG